MLTETGRQSAPVTVNLADSKSITCPSCNTGLQHAAGRQAEEHVGALDDVVQAARLGLLHVLALVVVHQLGAVRPNLAFAPIAAV